MSTNHIGSIPVPKMNGDQGACTALIRTYNSVLTLPDVIQSLREQDTPPVQFVIVDSGSTDNTLGLLPVGSTVHRYVGDSFNFSDAINQGLASVESEFVLIVSSHTSLGNEHALAFALELMAVDETIGAAYFCPEPVSGEDELRAERIDRNNFDGFNGVFNTCALVRCSLLAQRKFRPEVFSAEDQEWTAWLFNTHPNAGVVKVSGARVSYANPHQQSMRKRINEYVSVAYFVRHDLLGWANISRVAYSALLPARRRSVGSRRFYVDLACRLIACRLWPPRYNSKYF